MVRSDIVAGIRNALDRGYSIEQAKKVLINSGYEVKEVNEVSDYLTGGTGYTPKEISSQTFVSEDSEPEEVKNINPPSTTSKAELIILLVFLLILLGLLIVSFIFREMIIELLRDII